MSRPWPAASCVRALAWKVFGALGLLMAIGAGLARGDDLNEQRALGRQLFMQGAAPPCALCHTLADAGSTGQVGPVLDEIRPDAARVANAVRNGLGAMPPYRATLSEAQIQALAHYVANASSSAR